MSMAIDRAAGRVQVGPEPEHRPVVVHEVITRVEIVQQFDDRRVGRSEVTIEHAVARVRALARP